jgi:aspartate--ammonia ligase
MPNLYIDENYSSKLSLRETEHGIKMIKDFFQDHLAAALNLERVSAPLFVRKGSGVNDDLNGVEKKVAFTIKDEGCDAEVVFSLAKWKRMVLADYGFSEGQGLYTDMNAIRPDEECLDNLHSVYVDQWDWEKVMADGERNLDYLKATVRQIYEVMKATEKMTCEKYPQIEPILPDEITFVHSEDMALEYPDLNPRQREDMVTEKYGAVFVIGIGGEIPGGGIHDGRAPDYDDWNTVTSEGRRGLNGDILLWYPLLNRTFEISSMGIRVDSKMLEEQLRIRDALDRKKFDWHKKLLDGKLPQTIGGGIGQSRLCMFFLRKMHVGEVHASIWPKEMVAQCEKAGIRLL